MSNIIINFKKRTIEINKTFVSPSCLLYFDTLPAFSCLRKPPTAIGWRFVDGLMPPWGPVLLKGEGEKKTTKEIESIYGFLIFTTWKNYLPPIIMGLWIAIINKNLYVHILRPGYNRMKNTAQNQTVRQQRKADKVNFRFFCWLLLWCAGVLLISRAAKSANIAPLF